jgi:hypothetical protein
MHGNIFRISMLAVTTHIFEETSEINRGFVCPNEVGCRVYVSYKLVGDFSFNCFFFISVVAIFTFEYNRGKLIQCMVCEHCFQFLVIVFSWVNESISLRVNGTVNVRISFNCFSSVEVVQGVHIEHKECINMIYFDSKDQKR